LSADAFSQVRTVKNALASLMELAALPT